MRLRDEVERTVRAWHAHEQARGGRDVVDYDCAPPSEPVPAAASRLDVHEQFVALQKRAVEEGDAVIRRTVQAHLTYLAAVLGERLPLTDYVQATQGCPATGWPEEYLTAVGERARKGLADLGVSWGPTTDAELTAVEEPIDMGEARERVEAVAAEVEPTIRQLTGTTAPFTLSIELQDVDDYWAFWLDGAGSRARLRFNLRHATFTQTRLRQFAQHEILGHALQMASWSQTAAEQDVPWVRTLTVHQPYQVLLEGLATALPLFTTPDDIRLMARTRLTHYLHLVRAELHVAINAGASVRECTDHALARAPWFSRSQIGDALADRSTEPLLRSYLWSYPAGTDWFATLADEASPDVAARVLREAYRRPLTPDDLESLAMTRTWSSQDPGRDGSTTFSTRGLGDESGRGQRSNVHVEEP